MAKQDHFVALSEAHFMNPGTMAEIEYYPNTKRWWASVDGVMRAWSGRDLSGEWPPPVAESLIKHMDEAGVDVCFCLREGMMDMSGGVVSMSTNQFMIDQIAPYPERMYLEAMVGPILRRGVEHANWELEYMVKECNAKLCKVYQPEDLAPLDDKRMWPFYEKACELDISLTVHTGMSYVVPQPSRHTHPDTLDQILIDFPELRIIAYHMAWPHTEELIGLAGKHQNLYLSMSGIAGWYQRAPYRGYHAIGTALQYVDPSKIVMGLDLPFDDTKRVVDWVRTLQIPEELQKNYGYLEITDEMRAGFLGKNLARLAKIEPTKRVK
ncbi:MAG: amidohydrolase family protein [Deltaproteobacteria bacterium]|nr:amidohydrolase family protein [Deltaproteobacteria bacterium]MBW2418370.1 amidohydrolase family protein [Deltaproteobacteria bacterium]